jgi:preprotein translocase subunit SecY
MVPSTPAQTFKSVRTQQCWCRAYTGTRGSATSVYISGSSYVYRLRQVSEHCNARASAYGAAHGVHEWKDFAPLATVARKITFNVAALFFLVLGESVPLCCADASMLPRNTLQMLTHGSVAAHGSTPLAILHPFVLGIVPFVEAMIFCQVVGSLYGWDKLPVPEPYRLSRTQMQTPYGRAAVYFLSSVLGAVIATIMAAFTTMHLVNQGVVGHQEMWSITAALVAGSAIIYKLSDLITQFGLGQGVSFIYMVSIAASAHCCCQHACLKTCHCMCSGHCMRSGRVVQALTAGNTAQGCKASGSLRCSTCHWDKWRGALLLLSA